MCSNRKVAEVSLQWEEWRLCCIWLLNTMNSAMIVWQIKIIEIEKVAFKWIALLLQYYIEYEFDHEIQCMNMRKSVLKKKIPS